MATGTKTAYSRPEGNPSGGSHRRKALRGLDHVHWGHEQTPQTGGRFGRMFPRLERRPDVPPTPVDLGLSGGPMDGKKTNNKAIEAGFTFLGQFIDHDITLDLTSSLEQQTDPHALTNFRTPSLELDSVYGLGPDGSPHQYDKNDAGKLLLGRNCSVWDLPRNEQDVALIGDPRNDENMLVAQMHLAFLRFHNAVLDGVRQEQPKLDAGEQFEEAQRQVRWHYQWMIVHEFLPKICGNDIARKVFDPSYSRRFYRSRPGYPAYMPVEFSVAAYRFGHSMVQSKYRINDDYGFPLFREDGTSGESRNDLSGGPVAEEHAVNWKNFFYTGAKPSPKANIASSKIDALMEQPLLRLPDSVVGEKTPELFRSLAARNLQRSVALGLPAGQAVAKRMGLEVLREKDIWDRAPEFKGCPAPLWYYVLREAEICRDGESLGGVGGFIVAEVFHGLLHHDRASYVNSCYPWRPTLGSKPGHFGIVDLLKVAGVPTE